MNIIDIYRMTWYKDIKEPVLLIKLFSCYISRKRIRNEGIRHRAIYSIPEGLAIVAKPLFFYLT